ncbi:8-amino-7-oxononanoate synthase [Christiangramia fulva]|uniref:8-amino-7-oxononanoate synthase n=1 Tax=Christiangramia fulva TaxID=2126553 RepID=A0A2R3Z6B3_9FLAO|nr:aminotransferase class I/II-fold pyridoxal phosphate-dependent enzyme [Christiangramia fulva]AVR45754.1 8-amino-7-oxononanoate synthase [Christiangramia fulva]
MTFYLDQAAGRIINTDKGEFLYFGGTSYLGLQYDPEFQETLIENIKKYGTNFGASRKANIRLSVFEEFEDFIAGKTNCEDAICVSSGFLAGRMLLHYFSSKNYQQFCAPNTHPALIGRESRLFDKYSALEQEITAENTSEKETVLFLDSIDFDGNNFPDFEWLEKINLENTILVIDDSHGFGLIGEDGFGLNYYLKKLKPKELIICGSLGKALATPCGIISGSKKRINDLRNLGFYGGGSPPSPAALQTLLDSEILVKDRIRKVRKHIENFNSLTSAEFEAVRLPVHPVFTYENEKLTDHLFSENIITTNFHYPLPESPLLSKIVLSGGHTSEDIQKLIQSINKFYSK